MKRKNLDKSFKGSIIKSAKMMWNIFPLILGTILLVSLMVTLIPQSFYLKIFQGNAIIDPIMGSVLGSVSTGNPIISYLIGGELLKQGVSLIAVIAFIVSWVTVGFVQLPAESVMLGKKFALMRNLLSFIFAIIVAVITVIILGVL